MFEAYSLNKDLTENTAIPFDNVTIQKGCTAVLSGPSTIQFNKCGVYMVGVDASVTSTDAADASMQLYKSGVAQPQGQASASVTAAGTSSLSFITLVQVPTNNSSCCCAIPTTIQVINTGDAVTYSNVNVVVTKIC